MVVRSEVQGPAVKSTSKCPKARLSRPCRRPGLKSQRSLRKSAALN